MIRVHFVGLLKHFFQCISTDDNMFEFYLNQ